MSAFSKKPNSGTKKSKHVLVLGRDSIVHPRSAVLIGYKYSSADGRRADTKTIQAAVDALRGYNPPEALLHLGSMTTKNDGNWGVYELQLLCAAIEGGGGNHLKLLELPYNNLNDECALLLANTIRTGKWPALEGFGFTNNNLTNTGVDYITNALKATGQSLKRFDLNGNYAVRVKWVGSPLIYETIP